MDVANTIARVYARLRDNPEFRLRYADRAHQHFFNDGTLTPQAAAARWQARADEIYTAIVAESARWGDFRRPDDPYTRDGQWQMELDRLTTTYFPQRTDILLEDLRAAELYPLLEAPAFNQHGGVIANGFVLEMTAPAGDIYYTLDGSDPRLAGGAVASSARLYQGPVTLNGMTTVKARSRVGDDWSALNEAVFVVYPATSENIAITELNYHPSDPTDAEVTAGFTDADDFEFLELHNHSSTAVDLSGVRFTNGITFHFSDAAVRQLAAGQRVVLVRNAAAFEFRYGTGLPVAGQYSARLSNSGERITLVDAAGAVIHDFAYDDEGDWPELADGLGSSLTVIDVAGNYSDPFNWHASGERLGTPAAEGSPVAVMARHVFYNDSHFDNHDASASAADNNAVATDKRPLFPGRSADFKNYTSYIHGLNGIQIDVRHLQDPVGLSQDDFEFRVGRSDAVTTWLAAPPPDGITVRPGAGVAGSDRITVIWPNGAIAQQWLQVTLLASPASGLVADDTFIFGSVIGESGNRDRLNTLVDGFDFAGTRDHASSAVLVDHVFDFDRDGNVDGTDLAIVRDHATQFHSALHLITPTAVAPPPVLLPENVSRSFAMESPLISRVVESPVTKTGLRPSDMEAYPHSSKSRRGRAEVRPPFESAAEIAGNPSSHGKLSIHENLKPPRYLYYM